MAACTKRFCVNDNNIEKEPLQKLILQRLFVLETSTIEDLNALLVLEMARSQATLFQVLLVIFFGAIKLRGWLDLRYNRRAKMAARVPAFFGAARNFFLLRVLEENCRAVLSADVRALAIQCRRVMALPEHIEQFVVGNLRRVERHLHDFGVSAATAANVFVGRGS